MEPIEISVSTSTQPEVQGRKKADLDAKLLKNKDTRQAARVNRLVVQGEEEKLPEEDYNLIDEYFTSTHADLQKRVTGWSTALQGAPVDEITVYFDNIHAESWALREQLTNYQYAIPTGMLSRYQATMRQFQDTFGEQKEAAMPKKKFTFVRKAKKAQPAAAAQQPEQP